jgi:hypothetical protein
MRVQCKEEGAEGASDERDGGCYSLCERRIAQTADYQEWKCRKDFKKNLHKYILSEVNEVNRKKVRGSHSDRTLMSTRAEIHGSKNQITIDTKQKTLPSEQPNWQYRLFARSWKSQRSEEVEEF